MKQETFLSVLLRHHKETLPHCKTDGKQICEASYTHAAHSSGSGLRKARPGQESSGYFFTQEIFQKARVWNVSRQLLRTARHKGTKHSSYRNNVRTTCIGTNPAHGCSNHTENIRTTEMEPPPAWEATTSWHYNTSLHKLGSKAKEAIQRELQEVF